jgi:hypothetical protein
VLLDVVTGLPVTAISKGPDAYPPSSGCCARGVTGCHMGRYGKSGDGPRGPLASYNQLSRDRSRYYLYHQPSYGLDLQILQEGYYREKSGICSTQLNDRFPV